MAYGQLHLSDNFGQLPTGVKIVPRPPHSVNQLSSFFVFLALSLPHRRITLAKGMKLKKKKKRSKSYVLCTEQRF